MINKKSLKKFKSKYSTIKLFVLMIVIGMIICLSGAYFFDNVEEDFLSSALLNVSAGLFTGLIILTYQYLSNRNLTEASRIIRNLKLLETIPVYYASEKDFSPYDPLQQEEYENFDITEIADDVEGIAYVLEKYKEEIKSMKINYNRIKEFSTNSYKLPLNFSSYELVLKQSEEYFYNYIEVDGYQPDEDRQLRIVFKNDVEVSIGEIYNEWIEKINYLAESSKSFNELFLRSKAELLSIHDKNSKVIH